MPPATVDVHAHALSPRLVELTASHREAANPHNEHLMRTRYKPAFESLDTRLATMDRQGIDMQVVSHMPNFAYWAERDLAEQIVDAANTTSPSSAAASRNGWSAWAWSRCSFQSWQPASSRPAWPR